MESSKLWLAGVIVAAVFVSEPDRANAQDQPAAARDAAALAVDGIVREVFQSARRDRVDYIVQIEVKRSEALRAPRAPLRVLVPAPGDMVYVHTSQRPENALGLSETGQGPTSERHGYGSDSPSRTSPGASISLSQSKRGGGWKRAGRDWFELTSKALAESSATDPAPAAVDRAPGSLGPRTTPPPGAARDSKAALTSLGLTGEAKTVQGRFVIRVLSVESGGAGQRAGLEPGDVIIGANDKLLTGIEQLEELTKQGGRVNLVVLDVNNGKTARVPVELPAGDRSGTPGTLPPLAGQPEARPTPKDATNANPRAAGRSLGISAEPVTIGQRTGMKVVGVQPDSPAQKAGIEPGDVIVSANGVAITGAEALSRRRQEERRQPLSHGARHAH